MSESLTIQSYPLSWPIGRRRTNHWQRQRSKFSNAKRPLSIMDGVERVIDQLKVLGVSRDDVVISCNVQPRLDGLPKSNLPEPSDPGVAVYWRRAGDKVPRCMPIDTFDRVADNLAAIAKTIDCYRMIERYGNAEMMERALDSLALLPAPECWWLTLRLSGPDASKEDIEAAYRRLISDHHPDKGGDADMAARINRARDQGLEAIL
jgi:hypothetical protein